MTATRRKPPELAAATRGSVSNRKRLPAPIGRVTALNDDVQKKVCDAVRAGAYLSVAARYAGVSPVTLANWMRRGREAPGPRSKDWIYRTFLESVEEAEAQSEVAANLQWRAAWAKDWHAAKDWLQNRYPDRYGPNRDPNATPLAMAGVNLTIHTGTAPNGTISATAAAASAPLEQLIEANPSLLSATMHLFDEIDAIYGEQQPQPEPVVKQLGPSYSPNEVIEGEYIPVEIDDEGNL